MAEYRIYKLDHGGYVNAPPKVIFHSTDEQAIALAQELFDGAECELWQGARLVLHLPIGLVRTGTA